MFDRAALRMSQEVQRKRFEGTPADPALFDPKQWKKADLIDGLRNAAQELLPAAPTRQSVHTIRNRCREAVKKHGLGFTYEVFRLAREAGNLPAYWSESRDQAESLIDAIEAGDPIEVVVADRPRSGTAPENNSGKVIRIVAFSRDEDSGNETVYDIIDIDAENVFSNKGGLSSRITRPLRDLLENEPWVSRISIERAKKSV